MVVLGAAGKAVFVGVLYVLSAIEFFVVFWVILSWVVFFASRSSFRWKYRKFFDVLIVINGFLESITRPILKPFRKILPPWKTGGIDVSPLLLLLAILMIRVFVQELYRGLLAG